MQNISIPSTATSRVPFKSIALPVEHGSWGFLFEPLLAGLLIVPSLGGLSLSLFVIGAFLARQPLKFVIGDLTKKKHLPRTGVAIRFAAIFGGISLLGFSLSVLTVSAQAFIPFVITIPFVIYLLIQDAARQSREIVAELLAAAVLAASISSLAIAGGLGYTLAFVLWLTMLARLIPSVLFVRSRLRLEKGKDYTVLVPVATHIAGLGAVAYFWLASIGSVLTVAASTFLLGRAAIGLSKYGSKMTARQLGVREVIYGVIYAATIVIGYYAGI
jgi:hypothetical protein